MADTLDVLTLDEAKDAVGVKGTAQDLVVGMYVTGISRRLDKACGAIVRRTITSETHNGGSPSIRLKHPATSFTAVTEYQGTTGVTLTRETLGTAPGDGYLADPHEPDDSLFSGRLWRRSGGYDRCFWAGRRNIAVTYVPGRYATTASVDARFKEAAIVVLKNAWGTEEPSADALGDYDAPTGRFPKFAIPNAARQLLRDEWRETKGLA